MMVGQELESVKSLCCASGGFGLSRKNRNKGAQPKILVLLTVCIHVNALLSPSHNLKLNTDKH
jgi:hypothetical protein